MVGEHIRALKGGRWTHAIDCGDETVIHLADDGAAPPRVRRSYRPEFIAGADGVEVVRHRERTFPANEVVARAYSRISDPGLAAVFRDSEAFAEWCVTGRLPAAAPNRAGAVPGPARAAASSPPAAPAPVLARAVPAAKPPPAKAERAPRAAAAPRRKGAAAAKAKRGAAARSPRAAPKPAAKSKAKAGGKRAASKGARRAATARRR